MELITSMLHLLEVSVMLTIASVMLTIFALGLRPRPQDTTYLFHSGAVIEVASVDERRHAAIHGLRSSTCTRSWR